MTGELGKLESHEERENVEDKKISEAELETKETAITAATCPQKESHQDRLNRICQACGELIPGHGMYTPEEFQKFFAPPGHGQSAPSHPVFETAEMKELTEKQAALWVEHERARLAYADALFKVEDLKRGRTGARGRDADPATGRNFDQQIAAAQERAEALYEGGKAIAREINRVDQIRKAKHQQAVWAESYPPDAPAGSIAARIAALVRGNA